VIGRLLFCSAYALRRGRQAPFVHVERNSSTPVRRRFSLTQEGLSRVIPGGEEPGDGINVWRRETVSAIPYSTYDLSRKLQLYWTYLGLSGVSAQPVQMGSSIEFSLLCSWCEQESIVEKMSGSIARRARDSVAFFRRSSVGLIPARTTRLV